MRRDDESSMKSENQSSKLSKRRLWMIILIYAIGFSILCYPLISQWWNQHKQQSMVQSYTEAVTHQPKQTIRRIKYRAIQYNHALAKRGTTLYQGKDKGLHYNQQLKFENTTVMAVIHIPSLSIELPIYHGTSEQALEVGVGHLQDSSLPIGGVSTHAVLTGHTGLPSGGTLFTPLVNIKEGQLFSIDVLNETLFYQVYKIEVVKPSQMKSLDIQPGKDLVTLITCTPYGVNSHRLLVHGKRIPMDLTTKSNAYILSPFKTWLLFIVVVMSGVILIRCIIWFVKKCKSYEKE